MGPDGDGRATTTGPGLRGWQIENEAVQVQSSKAEPKVLPVSGCPQLVWSRLLSIAPMTLTGLGRSFLLSLRTGLVV